MFIFKGVFLAIDVVEFYLFIQSYIISLLSEVFRTFSLNVNIDISIFKSIVPCHFWFCITLPVLSPLFLSFPAAFFISRVLCLPVIGVGFPICIFNLPQSACCHVSNYRDL